MAIKSQQDIKNQTKAKGEKIPKVFENVAQKDPEPQQNNQPIVPLIQRVENIENYLKRVDMAFEKIVTELDNLRNLIKVTQIMDSEISKLTGDMIRLTKLEEDRYIELAGAVNTMHEQIKTIDEFVPVYVDQRINDYFEDLASEPTTEEQPLEQDK